MQNLTNFDSEFKVVIRFDLKRQKILQKFYIFYNFFFIFKNLFFYNRTKIKLKNYLILIERENKNLYL